MDHSRAQAGSSRSLVYGIAEKAVFAAAVALLVWPYTVALKTHALGYFNDDGIYVVTAKALAEGRGYSLISLPQVIPQTKYPILFPLFLAGIWKLAPEFPRNVWLLRLAPFVWALAWFGLSYLLLKSEGCSSRRSRWLAVMVAGLPTVVFVSVTVVAETMFAALLTAALLLLGRAERGGRGAAPDANAIGAGVLAGAAFLARTAGLPLLLAGAVGLGARRKFRSAAAYVALWLLLAAPWIVWQRTRYEPPPREEAYYTLANYRQWNAVWNFTPAEKAAIVWKNLEALASAPGMLIAIGPTLLALVGLLVSALAVWGWLEDRRRWRSSLWLFLPLYLVEVVLWAYPPRRFVIPIMALVLHYAWRGVQACCRLAALSERRVGIAGAVVLSVLLTNALARHAQMTSRDGEVYLASDPQEWHRMEAIFAWVRVQTPPQATILASWDTAVYLYTGRRALRGYFPNAYEMSYAEKPRQPLGTASDLVQAIVRQKVDYVVEACDPRDQSSEAHFFTALIEELGKRYPGSLRAELEAAPGYVLSHVNRGALTGHGPNPSGR